MFPEEIQTISGQEAVDMAADVAEGRLDYPHIRLSFDGLGPDSGGMIAWQWELLNPLERDALCNLIDVMNKRSREL